MNSYAAGVNVTVTLPLEDLNGDALTPTALSWRLLDETETEVVAPTALTPVDGDTEVVIVIPANRNALSAGQTATLREIELSVTTTAGVVLVRSAYRVLAATTIVTLQNSFQTFGQARLLATSIPKILGWETATEDEQKQALIEAFTRLTRLGYRVKWPDSTNLLWQQRLQLPEHERIPPHIWGLMTLQQWQTYYPEEFRVAIRRAQLIEADDILAGSVIEQRREAGLLSESIGQSSMMFRSGKPLKMGVSARALREIEGYIDIRMTVARV